TAMINDVAGWLGFSVLLAPVRGGSIDPKQVAMTVGATTVFTAFSLLAGRRGVDWLLGRIDPQSPSGPGRILSTVMLLALFAASTTHAIGVHAVLGGFVVGVAVGGSTKVRQRTRVVIEDFVMNVFAPVFFASLGLRVDFVRAFDLRLCALVFVI